MQAEAEAELGDVTDIYKANDSASLGAKQAPKLLVAAANAGNADLIANSEDAKSAQLDSLLAKASQYSAFIRNSQDHAQVAYEAHASKMMQVAAGEQDEDVEEETSDGKKRKKGGKSGKKKKAKQLSAEEAKQAHAGAAGKMAASKEHQAAVIEWQPSSLKGELKDYQREGLRWMTTLYENGLSGILADEMGLGKTIQVIALMAYLNEKEVKGPFIITAPLATLPNWMKEFKKWLPNMQTLLYHGSKPERKDMLDRHFRQDQTGRYPVMITSYEICIIDRRHLEKFKWQYLVVDEGQRVKNRNCRLIRELKALDTQNRLLLSGTPIQNTLDELWSLLNFVNPQIFDNLEIFQSWFGFSDIGKKGTQEDEIMEQQTNDKIVSKLHEILRPFLLRRLKRDVLIDMPPKKEIVVYTPMSALQRDYYALALGGNLRNKLLEMGLSGGRDCSQININMNLRKISQHPFLFGEPNDESGQPICDNRPDLLVSASGKFKVLDKMLIKQKEQGHQVLIFSQMTELLNIMEDYLRWRQWRYCRIDGSVKIQERQAQMDAFNTDPDIFVFMLSTRAGGLGINLQAADTVILFDSDWNPHQDAQAQDRCHRIGQTKPVLVYRFLTIGSVEIDMMEKQMSKKKLERMAVSGGNFSKPGQQRTAQSFTLDTLRNLLADDVNAIDKRAEVEDQTEGIGDRELTDILDRKKVFSDWNFETNRLSGKPMLIPNEGEMYDVITTDDGKGGIMGGLS